ncbi:MAG: phosphoribulokinase [Chloroflexaceae bacterium]|nr:phosphoribulokinase [Chloroflexaceae bacterium]
MVQTQRPVMVGVVGDSATGKTTITDGLVTLIGADRVTHVSTDDYHKYDRKERAALDITALHPECNYLDILEQHLHHLRQGDAILKPVYDHATGSLTRPVYVQPREFVIVEGLLGFYTPAMRDMYDVKVYLDPAETLRRHWKMTRDTARRGYTPEQVLQQLQNREADSQQFIRPQREHSDIVVHFYPPMGQVAAIAGSHLNVRLTLNPTVLHPALSYLWQENPSEHAGIRIEMERDQHNQTVVILEIDGNVCPERASALEQSIWQHLLDVHPLRADEFGDYDDRTQRRHSDPLALTQLLLTCQVLQQYHQLHSSDSGEADNTALLQRLWLVATNTLLSGSGSPGSVRRLPGRLAQRSVRSSSKPSGTMR